jgi:uncharacterized membrane protein
MTPKLILLIACRLLVFSVAFNVLCQFGPAMVGVHDPQMFSILGVALGAIVLLLFAQNLFARGLPETPLKTKVQPQQVTQLLLLFIALNSLIENLTALISHFVTGQITSPAAFVIALIMSAGLLAAAKPIALLISPLPKETV